MKHDIYGEVPVGFVAPRPGRTLGQTSLFEYCRSKLVAFKVPTAVLVVDTIPKNANGKIDRDALSALYDLRVQAAKPRRSRSLTSASNWSRP